MKFSFDESEIMNHYLDQEEEKPTKEVFIQKLDDVKTNTEDSELIEVCSSIIVKLKNLDKEKYNNLISELPVDTISVY